MKTKLRIKTLPEITVIYERKKRIGKILQFAGFVMLGIVAFIGCVDIFFIHTLGSKILFGVAVLVTYICFSIGWKLNSTEQPLVTFGKQRFLKNYKTDKRARQTQEN